MAYHPAAFARKGRAVLAEARYRLASAGSDVQKVRRLVTYYDRRVHELMKERQEMDKEAYRDRAISCFQWGGSMTFFVILLGVILYSAITDTTVAVVYILLISAVGGLVGGSFIMTWRAPKDLSHRERKNRLLMKLYQDKNMLRMCYEAVIQAYKALLEEEERRIALQQQQAAFQRRTQRANAWLKETVREEKKRKWAALDAMEQQTKSLRPMSTVLSIGKGARGATQATKGRSAGKNRWFTLIWKRLHLFGGRERAHKEEVQTSEKPRLLLIADKDETIQSLLERLGHSFDLSVIRAVPENVEEHMSPPPRAVLVDLDRSAGDGLEVVRKLNGLEGIDGTPVIALSRRSNVENRDRAMAAGLAEYIVKETDKNGWLLNDPERLIEQIEQGIRRFEEGSDEVRVKEEVGRMEALLNEVPVEERYEQANGVNQEPPKKGRLLLVCEADDPFSIQKSLEDWGYEVIALQNPRRTIEIALAEQSDLILIDDGLREVNAFNVYRMLRMRAGSLPIFMIVASDEEYKAKEMGIGVYLLKPLNPKELERIGLIISVLEEQAVTRR